jgi:hypothetical protein
MNPLQALPLEQMESLIDELERLGDPAVREQARTLVRLVLRLHGEGLARLVEVTRRSPGGAALLAAWKEDPAIAGLLLLHDVHPDDLAARVQRALDRVAPVASFLGIEVRLLHVGEEKVDCELSVRSEVPRHALAELQSRIESAILEEAPEVQAVAFAGGAVRRFSLPLIAPGSLHRENRSGP